MADGLAQYDQKCAGMLDKNGWPPIFSLVAYCGGASAKNNNSSSTVPYRRPQLEMMINALVSAAPGAIVTSAHDGATILHVMVHAQSPHWMMRRVMNESPGLISARDQNGANMLHAVCASPVPWREGRLVGRILHEHVAAPEEVDSDGHTPLWRMLTNETVGNERWRYEVVSAILKSSKGVAATHKNPLQHNRIPLHYALSNAHYELARLLVREHPSEDGGLSARDYHGELPLHAALEKSRTPIDETTMKWLVTTYPDGPGTLSANRKLPLHFAQRRRFPEFVKKWLLSCHVGDSVAVAAVNSETLRDGIHALTQRFPERAVLCDAQGNLPLHYALRADSDPEIVKELLMLNPSTSQQPDAEGLPPLFVAATRGENQHTIAHFDAIHATAPLAIKDLAHTRTALHYAVQHRQPLPVIQWLVSHHQWQCKHRDTLGRAPAHFAWENRMSSATQLLLSVFADLDDLLLRIDLELLRMCLNSRGCVFMVDVVGGNILHRFASNPRATHVSRAIAWYQPWLCRHRNGRGQTPLDVARDTEKGGTRATLLPLEQAERLRLPPEDGVGLDQDGSRRRRTRANVKQVGGGLQRVSPGGMLMNAAASMDLEVRQGARTIEFFSSGSDDDDNDDDSDNGDSDRMFGGDPLYNMRLSEMPPEDGLRSILDVFWLTLGPQRSSIAEKLAACRRRGQLSVFHLLCNSLGRVRKYMTQWKHVPMLPLIIPVRWMGEGFGSGEIENEIRLSTLAVLRKAIGFKSKSLENICDFSHFKLYFLCEAPFLAPSAPDDVNTDEDHNPGCFDFPHAPWVGYDIVRPGAESIIKLRPLVILALSVLKAALFAQEFLERMEEEDNDETNDNKEEEDDREEEDKEDEKAQKVRAQRLEERKTLQAMAKWGSSVPSVFKEFHSPLQSNDLALSYLIECFASPIESDSDRLVWFGRKSMNVAFAELERVCRDAETAAAASASPPSYVPHEVRDGRHGDGGRNKHGKRPLRFAVHMGNGHPVHVCPRHAESTKFAATFRFPPPPLQTIAGDGDEEEGISILDQGLSFSSPLVSSPSSSKYAVHKGRLEGYSSECKAQLRGLLSNNQSEFTVRRNRNRQRAGKKRKTAALAARCGRVERGTSGMDSITPSEIADVQLRGGMHIVERLRRMRGTDSARGCAVQ